MSYVRFFCLFIALNAFAVVPSGSFASQVQMESFYRDVKTLRANFSQQVLDETGTVIDSSSGVLLLSRPDRFRWDYFAEPTSLASGSVDLIQQIISDGELLSIYDIELEQVTQRNLTDAMSQVPSLSLVASEQELGTFFTITELDNAADPTDGSAISWVLLRPVMDNAGFDQMMLGFSAGVLKQMIVFDALGNETRLNLTAVEINVVLADALFELSAPAGVDVFVQ